MKKLIEACDVCFPCLTEYGDAPIGLECPAFGRSLVIIGGRVIEFNKREERMRRWKKERKRWGERRDGYATCLRSMNKHALCGERLSDVAYRNAREKTWSCADANRKIKSDYDCGAKRRARFVCENRERERGGERDRRLSTPVNLTSIDELIRSLRQWRFIRQ